MTSSRSRFVRAWLTGGCAAVIASSPLGSAPGLAQPPAAPSANADVTTVAPLTVRPDIPVDVPTLQTEVKALGQAATDAHDTLIGDIWNACANDESEAEGDLPGGHFDSLDSLFFALMRTDAHAQYAVQVAAGSAQTATQNALDARSAGSDNTIVNADLARQTAVGAYQRAQMIARESHQRVADFQDMGRLAAMRNISLGAPPIPDEIVALLNGVTRERMQNPNAAGVFVPTEYANLGLSNIVARQVTIAGAPAIHISGTIHNPLKKAIPVPPLWFTAIDQDGTPLKSEQGKSPAFTKHIPAGGSLDFTYDIKPMPQTTLRTIVTFAPQERPRRDKPGGGCDVPHAELEALNAGTFSPPDAPWITGKPALGPKKPKMGSLAVPLGPPPTDSGNSIGRALVRQYGFPTSPDFVPPNQ